MVDKADVGQLFVQLFAAQVFLGRDLTGGPFLIRRSYGIGT